MNIHLDGPNTEGLFLYMQVRQLAVRTLSEFELDSLEKVILSRSHMVAKWLKEGLSEIVSESTTINRGTSL